MPHPIIAIVTGKSWLRLVWKQPELIYGDVIEMPAAAKRGGTTRVSSGGLVAQEAIARSHGERS